jgi:hypothetical protein
MVVLWDGPIDEPKGETKNRSEMLATFEVRVANLEKVLRLSRECCFSDLAILIEADIVNTFLPSVTLLLCLVDDGDERRKVAALGRRLRACIG